MRKLSQIFEKDSYSDSYSEETTEKAEKIIKVSPAEWSAWEKFLDGRISDDAKKLLYILKSNAITDSKTWDNIRYSTSSAAKRACVNAGIDDKDANALIELIKKVGGEANAVPMATSAEGRASIMKNPKLLNDLLVDRQSEKGIKDTIKKYTPMINKLVSKYAAVSPLDKGELLSVAKEAVLNATRTYFKGNKETNMEFTGFLQFQIFNAIQNEIHQNGYIIRIPQSQQEKYLKNNSSVNHVMSYDRITGNDGDDYDSDKLGFLGMTDERIGGQEDPQKFKMLMDLITRKFGDQKAEVFFKTFGINGYKKTQGNEIAKQIGKSAVMVTKINKEITSWLKSQVGKGRVGELLGELQDIYTEGLLIANAYESKDKFYNNIINDDLYVALNEGNIELTPEAVEAAINSQSIETSYFIIECIRNGYAWLDKNYRKNKYKLVDFLYDLYQTENIYKWSDASILEAMSKVIALEPKLRNLLK